MIGIEIRTNNKTEADKGGNIPKQWQKFFNEGVLQRIPNKTRSKIYTLFTDYESDRNGEYGYVIGAKVEKGTAPPEGMVAKTVVAGAYTMLNSEEGPFAKVVPQAWRKVWALEDEASIHRRYKTDFEVYDIQSADGQSGRISLYVGTQ